MRILKAQLPINCQSVDDNKFKRHSLSPGVVPSSTDSGAKGGRWLDRGEGVIGERFIFLSVNLFSFFSDRTKSGPPQRPEWHGSRDVRKSCENVIFLHKHFPPPNYSKLEDVPRCPFSVTCRLVSKAHAWFHFSQWIDDQHVWALRVALRAPVVMRGLQNWATMRSRRAKVFSGLWLLFTATIVHLCLMCTLSEFVLGVSSLINTILYFPSLF